MVKQIYLEVLSKSYGRGFNMKKLEERELKELKGGASVGTYIIIGGIIVFLIGVVDGYIRPLKCN